MYKINNILCFLGFHKWGKHPKITYKYLSSNGSSTHLCERCGKVEKTQYFNVFTGEKYRTFVLPVQDSRGTR